MNKNNLIEWIKKINKNNNFIEENIIELYNRQTTDEQKLETNQYKNNIGFRANHARRGSQLAKIVLSGKKLNNIQLLEAKYIIMYYHRQLVVECS